VEICERARDDGSQLGGEKKQRLNVEQVRTLEKKNLELKNKLEPAQGTAIARWGCSPGRWSSGSRTTAGGGRQSRTTTC
jgi:hypothetical protein